MPDNDGVVARGVSYPHAMVGASLKLAAGTWWPDDSWHVVDYARVIGHGENDFSQAVENLVTWRAHQAAGVRVMEGPRSEKLKPGTTVQLHFLGTVSPCRIIASESLVLDDGGRKRTLVYGTEYGHIECGEEAFIIEMAPGGEVTGRCVAFSRHSWWLARVFNGPARMVQRWATRRYVRGMQPRFGKHGNGELK